jgi:hypothetical protein
MRSVGPHRGPVVRDHDLVADGYDAVSETFSNLKSIASTSTWSRRTNNVLFERVCRSVLCAL